jgi:glutathione S-transferase
MFIYIDLRQPDRDWRAAHPNLAQWFAGMSERDSVKATLKN